MIRPAKRKDISQISSIYNHYVNTSIATFDTEEKSVEEMEEKWLGLKESFPFLVFEVDDEILGYAYASPWKERKAYKRTVETSIYLKPTAQGGGIGRKLYAHLIESLQNMQIHVALGGISLPNKASVALHEKLGFTKSGVLREVGHKFDKWIDVGYWQLDL